LLVYPLLAMFLAAAWKQNDLRTGQMVRFIRDNIEKHIGSSPTELGWENYRAAVFPPSRLTPFSVSGVFIVTQLLAIALASLRFVPLSVSLIQIGHLDHDRAELVVDGVLLVVALVSVVATFVILWRKRF
jgi:di/tricarboxylate transporter